MRQGDAERPTVRTDIDDKTKDKVNLYVGSLIMDRLGDVPFRVARKYRQ